MDSGIRVATCKTGNRRLLDEIFESKPIKKGVKSHFDSPRSHSNSKSTPTKTRMSFQTANNNTFAMAPTSPNPYVSRRLNNIDQAQIMKREREDWERMYHKTVKRIEVMIDVQRMLKDMKKIAEETNTIVTEIKRTILMASTNN